MAVKQLSSSELITIIDRLFFLKGPAGLLRSVTSMAQVYGGDLDKEALMGMEKASQDILDELNAIMACMREDEPAKPQA